MALGGIPFNGDNYRRIIRLYDVDGVTLLETLCDKQTGTNVVEAAEFEWRRQGGCGTGSFAISRSFADRGVFQLGQLIECAYDGTSGNWYQGRIEEVKENSPAGVTLRTEGLVSKLNDVVIGTFQQDAGKPRLYARSPVYYPGDPDLEAQTWITATYFHTVVERFYTDFIQPLGIGLDTIEHPEEEIDFYSMVFRGEQSVAEALRAFALTCYGASWGISPSGNFFFKAKPTSAIHSYRYGQHLEALERTRDRDMMYNYIDLIGGYVYIPPSLRPGSHYRYTSFWYNQDSIDIYGKRNAQLYVPFIRNDLDAARFKTQFFGQYSTPYLRYTATTIGQGGPLFPWDTQVTLQDKTGSSLITSLFDSCTVQFNEAPTFTLTTGPEELQFPSAPVQQNWEEPPPGSPAGPVESDPDFTFESTGTVPPTCNCPPGYVPIQLKTCDGANNRKVCIDEELVKDCKCPKNIIMITTYDSSVAYANICTYENTETGAPPGNCPQFADCVVITQDFPGVDSTTDTDELVADFLEQCPEARERKATLTRQTTAPTMYPGGMALEGEGPWRVSLSNLWCLDYDFPPPGGELRSMYFSIAYDEDAQRWYYAQWSANFENPNPSNVDILFADGDETYTGPFYTNINPETGQEDSSGDSTDGPFETDILLAQDCGEDEPPDAGVIPDENPGDCVYPPLEIDISQYQDDKTTLEAALDADFKLAAGNIAGGFRCWAGGNDSVKPAGESEPSDSFGPMELVTTGTDEDNRIDLDDLQNLFITLHSKHTDVKPYVFWFITDITGSIDPAEWIGVYDAFIDWVETNYPNVQIKASQSDGGGNNIASERWLATMLNRYQREL